MLSFPSPHTVPASIPSAPPSKTLAACSFNSRSFPWKRSWTVSMPWAAGAPRSTTQNVSNQKWYGCPVDDVLCLSVLCDRKTFVDGAAMYGVFSCETARYEAHCGDEPGRTCTEAGHLTVWKVHYTLWSTIQPGQRHHGSRTTEALYHYHPQDMHNLINSSLILHHPLL